MNSAQIPQERAKPKALRHGFGIAGVNAGVPITTLQKWLGHSRLETTAIYTNALGDEEHELASRIWKRTPL